MTDTSSLRVTKIASTTRLSDRYLTVQIKDAPEKEQVATYGQLAALVEIEGSWQSNAQIGQTIINTLSRQYFRGTARDPLTNFEEALKRVNETLTQATHTGSTDWIGHLHAAIVVVLGNEIHIATTGNVYAMLFREATATPMLDEHRDAPTVPGKVFGTLLSGTIDKDDHLLIASSGLQKIATQQEIQHCFAETKGVPDPIAQLSGLLRAKRGRWVQALCIDTADQPDVASAARTVVLEDGTSMQLSWTLDRIRSAIQRAIEPITPFIHKAKASAQATIKRIIPTGKERFEQTKVWSTAQFDHLRQDTLPQLRAKSDPLLARAKTWLASIRQPKSAPQAPIEPPRPVADPMTENLIGKSVFAIRDYTESPEPSTPVSLPTITEYTEPKQTNRPALRLPIVSARTFARIGAKLEWRSILFGIIAIVLFVILLSNIHVISRQRQNEQSKQAYLTQLNELQDKLEEARLARVFNQPEKATAALQTVIADLPALLQSPVADGARILQNKTQIEIDTLTQTNRITDLKELTKVEGATRLVRANDLLTFTNTAGTLLATLDGVETKSTIILVPAGQLVTALTGYDGKVAAAVITNQGAYELNGTDTQLKALQTSGTWKTSTAVTTFFNNLYLLNVPDNQIWKYTATQTGFGKADGYITDGTKLDGAVDVAVDGELYVLNKDGSIFKFNRGKKEAFTLAAPPAPTNTISQAKQLLTTKDSSFLYLLDGNRVLRYDKSGHFQAQYAFQGIDTVDSIALDEPQKTFYVLSGGTLYSVQF